MGLSGLRLNQSRSDTIPGPRSSSLSDGGLSIVRARNDSGEITLQKIDLSGRESQRTCAAIGDDIENEPPEPGIDFLFSRSPVIRITLEHDALPYFVVSEPKRPEPDDSVNAHAEAAVPRERPVLKTLGQPVLGKDADAVKDAIDGCVRRGNRKATVTSSMSSATIGSPSI